MAEEDQSQRHSNSSGGSGGGGGGNGYDHHRASKKLKAKKIPQRGLGVAQLEKIRLEEIQKNDVSSSNLPPPTNSIISRSNSLNCLAFRPTISSSSPLLPFPPPSGGGESGWLMGGRGGSWPNLWSDEHNHNAEGENRGGFGFMKNVRLPYESNSPTWPFMQQRSQQFQQPSSSSSMVNVSTGTSSAAAAASVLNFQMEPPSNQSYCGKNNFTPPLWPEEDRMVGMKRLYPFPMENELIPDFHCKLPSTFVSPLSRSDESASCSNGGTNREGPSTSSAIFEPILKKVVKENGEGLKGDFLTLGLPERHSSSSTRQMLQLSTKLSLHCQDASQSVESLTPQGTKDDPIHVSGEGGLLKQQTFINFLPPAKTNSEQAISRRRSNSNGGGTRECVDLNLKL